MYEILLRAQYTHVLCTNSFATMSKPVDYSKWDHIELSDDEDDVHPNIDKESWFRMKHRSRVEREETEEKDKKKILDEVRFSIFVIIHRIAVFQCLHFPRCPKPISVFKCWSMTWSGSI
jgi:hypothetical protein